MQDTKQKSKDTLKTTSAKSLEKNTSLPKIDIVEAETRLASMAEQVYHYNAKTGGRMSYMATEQGTLIIVASLPGYRLGVVQTESGLLPTINGKVVE